VGTRRFGGEELEHSDRVEDCDDGEHDAQDDKPDSQ
jgi:hypothetical protein